MSRIEPTRPEQITPVPEPTPSAQDSSSPGDGQGQSAAPKSADTFERVAGNGLPTPTSLVFTPSEASPEPSAATALGAAPGDLATVAAPPVAVSPAREGAYNPSEDPTFTDSLKDALKKLATDPARFSDFSQKVFGPLRPNAVEDLRQAILQQRWDQILPDTQVVEFEADRISGAYAPETEVIYLQDADRMTMRDTYLEELGHHWQRLLAPSGSDPLNDTLGDEGRIFADHFVLNDEGLVSSIDVDASIEAGLRRENDVGQIQVIGPDGTPVT